MLAAVIIPWPWIWSLKIMVPSACTVRQQEEFVHRYSRMRGKNAQGQMERRLYLFEVISKLSYKVQAVFKHHIWRWNNMLTGGWMGGCVCVWGGGWKAILRLCFSGSKNSSCWAGSEAELQSLLLLPFFILIPSLTFSHTTMHHPNGAREVAWRASAERRFGPSCSTPVFKLLSTQSTIGRRARF